MKRVFFSLGLILSITHSYSQTDTELFKKAMKNLSVLAGEWKGEAIYKMGGKESKIDMTEKIAFAVDSIVLVFDGLGVPKGSVESKDIFKALSILNYHPETKNYRFRVFLHDGKFSEVEFNEVKPNNFEWQLKIPSGEMRYSIVIDPIKKIWKENGLFSRDGKSWQPFFEMNLTKL